MANAGEYSGNRDCDGEVGGKSQRRKVGLVYDETMCKHDTPDGEDHPECPDRIRVVWEKLQLAGVAQRCVVLGGSKAEDKHLQLVHAKDHVNKVKSLSTKKKDYRRNKIASKLDSIYLNGGSSEAAYLAAGSVVEVAEKVAQGELDSGFAIVRPPGHHAEADEARGFCLFNNVAVAASYLLTERTDLGLKKILIVDWDVHHGNGTQKMFWKDPRVLVFSVHRHENGSFYPPGDDGYYDMVGEGPGEGFNINVPWEQGRCGDPDYLAAWDHILIPVAKEFNPDIILVSAGFDAAIGDPLGGCLVTPYGYSVMLNKLMEFAQGKIVMALEGGYNLDSTAKSSLACVQVLLEGKPIQGSCEAYPFESTWRVILAVRKRLCAYWPSLADELLWKMTDQKTHTPLKVQEMEAERSSVINCLKEIAELKSALSAKEAEVKALETELGASKLTIQAKDRELKALETEFGVSKLTIQAKDRELKAMETELGASKLTIQAKDRELKAIETELGASKLTIQAKDRELKAIETELGASKLTIQAKDRELKAIETELRASKLTIQAKDRELKAIETELGELKMTIQVKDRELKALETELGASKSTNQARKGCIVHRAEKLIKEIEAASGCLYRVSPTKLTLASYPPDFGTRLKKIRKNKTVWWPDVLEHSWTCSPSCLRMGGANCDDIPSYAAQFAEDDVVSANGADQLEFANAAPEDVPAERIVEVGGNVAGQEETRRARSAELEAARAEKRIADRRIGSAPPVRAGSKRSSRGSPMDRPSGTAKPGGSSRRGDPPARGVFTAPEDHVQGFSEGVDHSFTFGYKERDVQFSGNRLVCGDLASQVRGDFSDFPAPDFLLGVNYYRDLASKQFQTMSSANRLVSFYEGRYREAVKEALDSKAAADVALRRAQINERSKQQEKSRADELQERLTRAEAKISSEQKRLRDTRTSAVRAEQKKVEGQIRELRGRIDRLSKHILSLKARDRPRLLFNQVRGTKEYRGDHCRWF